MKNWSQAERRLMTWIVYILVPMSGVCVDIYVPSLPHVVTALGVSKTWVQLTIPVFSIGMALGQLIVGPVSDAIGRKPLIIFGAIFQLLCLLFIVSTHSIDVILFCRLLQGLCLSMMMVPVRVIMSDLYSGDEFKKKVTIMTVCWSLGPIIAPVIGGYLQHFFSWHAPFYFMMGYDVLALLLAVTVLKETIQHRVAFSFKQLLSNYRILFKDRRVMSAILIAGILIAYMLLFNVVSPFFVQQVLGYSAVVYGRVAFLIGSAWLLGTLFAKKFAVVSDNKKIPLVLSLITITTLIMCVLTFMLPFQLWQLLLLGVLVIAFAGVLTPGITASTLQLHAQIPATLSALLFSGIWLVGSMITTLGSVLKTKNLLPLEWTYLGITVLAILVYYVYYRQKKVVNVRCKAKLRVKQFSMQCQSTVGC